MPKLQKVIKQHDSARQFGQEKINTTLLTNNFYLVNICRQSVWFQGPPKDNSLLNEIRYIPITEFTTLVHTGKVLFVGMRGPKVEIWIPYPTDVEIHQQLMECEQLIQEQPLVLQHRQRKRL